MPVTSPRGSDFSTLAPCCVDNEANLAALAEQRMGAGRDLSSFVYVSAGIGIGGGIVLDGRLARGTHGLAGELGHVTVVPDGRLCGCGSRGCLETVVGADSGAGDEQIASALAAALRSVVRIIDPEAIVLGGTLGSRGEAFAELVQTELGDLGTRWPCEVRPAQLGADARALGAARVALDGILADPTLVPLAAGRPHPGTPRKSSSNLEQDIGTAAVLP